MTTIRAQVVLPYRSNRPEDVITNTWHFGVGDPVVDPTDYTTLASALTQCYLDMYALGMQAYINLPQCHINFYDLDDPEPRVPAYIDTDIGTTFGSSMPTGTSQLPTEVAACVSFQAPPISGGNQKRRRGRIFLGGITEAMITAASASSPFFPFWEPAFVTDVNDAVQANLIALDALTSGHIQWAVYSEADLQSYIVTNGWMDNTPDTQRRRGIISSLRNIWP